MSKKAKRNRKSAASRARGRRNGSGTAGQVPPKAISNGNQPFQPEHPTQPPGEGFSLWVTPPGQSGPQRRIDAGTPAANPSGMLSLANIGAPREQPGNVRVALGAPSQDAPDAEKNVPDFDPAGVLRRYVDGDHDGAVDACSKTLMAFDRVNYEVVTPEIRRRVNEFVETLLYLLTRPDLVLTRLQTMLLLGAHHTLANLVAISAFKSTDAHLAIIGEQERNYGKTLLLHSVRNRRRVNPKQLFDVDPEVASMWYATYGLCSVSAIAEHVWKNLKEHLAYVDERLQVPDHRINGLLFQATYVDDDLARAIKSRFNTDIQRQIGATTPKLTPVRDRIAIISGKWRRGTAVYRSLSPLVDTLRGKYRLTLVCLGKQEHGVDTEGFDEVRYVAQEGRAFKCGSVKETDFQLAFFPDVGMTSESIWLSNMRLAPIQAVGYGHPTTTAGSRIDYFIGGAEVELPDKAQQFYSERLVLIPGLAAVPVLPAYTPKFPPQESDCMVINLPWSVAKINYPIVMRLKAIQDRITRPVEFRFFPGSGLHRYHSVPIILKELGGILGTSARLYSERRYADYMGEQEQAHFALESYPFGGYNTVVDSLHLGKPIVTQEGDRFYNRASSALLRRVGLDELITHSEEEYIDKAVRLANDDDYRQDIADHLRKTNLKARIFDDDSAQYFCKAIDYLIENHERLQAEGSREPIFVR
ncbi:MAG: hypothetical protein RBS80_05680 [Thermoguttaceae bacterium]|nr:hypothetical protein [Thermoguttaceae bacterium]